jgi:hypothetical protein
MRALLIGAVILAVCICARHAWHYRHYTRPDGPWHCGEIQQLPNGGYDPCPHVPNK